MTPRASILAWLGKTFFYGDEPALRSALRRPIQLGRERDAARGGTRTTNRHTVLLTFRDEVKRQRLLAGAKAYSEEDAWRSNVAIEVAIEVDE